MPKLDTFHRPTYTADLWNYKVVTDPADGSQEEVYFFVRNIQLEVTPAFLGRMTIFFKDSDDDIMLWARLHRLKDKYGRELYPGGIYALSTFVPNMNMFGAREGFRAQAALEFSEGEL